MTQGRRTDLGEDATTPFTPAQPALDPSVHATPSAPLPGTSTTAAPHGAATMPTDPAWSNSQVEDEGVGARTASGATNPAGAARYEPAVGSPEATPGTTNARERWSAKKSALAAAITIGAASVVSIGAAAAMPAGSSGGMGGGMGGPGGGMGGMSQNQQGSSTQMGPGMQMPGGTTGSTGSGTSGSTGTGGTSGSTGTNGTSGQQGTAGQAPSGQQMPGQMPAAGAAGGSGATGSGATN